MRQTQKAPAPGATGSEGTKQSINATHSTMNPRALRLLRALTEQREITREEADRIAHASNAPHYVMELRDRYGIPVRLRWKAGRDFDGRPTRYGIYFLDTEGRARARQLLGEAKPCAI